MPLSSTKSSADLFIPNFCVIRTIFVVVIVVQLFAFVLVLLPINQTSQNFWHKLSLISLFVQWTALSSCALLCLLRPRLVKFNNSKAAIIIYVLLLVVLELISEITYWLIYPFSQLDYPSWHSTYLLRNLAVGMIVFALVLRYFYIQHQWEQKIKTEAAAKLEALQARIRPHFLFNSLNTIASLARVDPSRAEAATEDLADLFRATLKDAHSRISLGDECELCRRYLQIESLRLGDRLKIHWQIDKLPKDALIPPLTLQPILENAIYHGIERSLGGGEITIIGNQRKNKINITISNPVAVKQSFPGSPLHQGNHMAMENIRQRLMVYYGSQQQISVEENEHYYIVHLRFPYVNDPDADPYR